MINEVYLIIMLLLRSFYIGAEYFSYMLNLCCLQLVCHPRYPEQNCIHMYLEIQDSTHMHSELRRYSCHNVDSLA